MNALQYIAFRDELEKIARKDEPDRARRALSGAGISGGAVGGSLALGGLLDRAYGRAAMRPLAPLKLGLLAALPGALLGQLLPIMKKKKRKKKKTAALTKEAIFPALAVGLGLPAAIAGSAYLSTQLAKKLYGPLPRYKTTDAGRGGAFPRDHSKYVEHLDKKDAKRQKKLEAWRKAGNAAYRDRYEKVTGIQPSPEKVKAKKPKKGGYWWSTK